MSNQDYRTEMSDNGFRGNSGGNSGGDSGGTNRQHKDRLFKAIFGSPERKHLTLELYNAMNGSSYTNPEDIILRTIDDVVYMGMKNDVSFLLDQVMNLWEQQSTPNRNMPLRFLLYYAHVTERHVHMLDPRSGSIYANRAVELPTPRMVLFYSGSGEMPEYLYLSDAYANGEDPDLELRVKVINISSGHSHLLDQCRPLQDYTNFVESFHRYRETGELSDRAAAGRAIAELRPGEVQNYLEAHESEVVDMLLTEYDEEKTLKAIFYEGERAGRKEGLEQGIQQGLQQEQENSLRMLCDCVATGDMPIAAAVRRSTNYGVTDEADFRARAAAFGIQLPE